MKNIKKIILCFALIFVTAFALTACGPANVNGVQMGKAIGATVDKIKNYNNASAQTLSFVEVEEDLSNRLYLLEYMKAVAESSKYDDCKTPFKAKLTVSDGTNTMELNVNHLFKIDGNNVKVEMVATYDNTFDNADYECLNINYDFDNDTLISFESYSYIVQMDELYHLVYSEGVLKSLVVDESTEYTTLKNSTLAKAENLYNSTEVSSKVYDFSQEYVDVYNMYNPEYPIECA